MVAWCPGNRVNSSDSQKPVERPNILHQGFLLDFLAQIGVDVSVQHVDPVSRLGQDTRQGTESQDFFQVERWSQFLSDERIHGPLDDPSGQEIHLETA